MSTSSEDVLLQVGQVRYKKGDGTLYVMNERLAWMVDQRDHVVVSHRYTEIKMQKISPDGKPKIQLQVVLHDGSTSTFQFVNRQGYSAQRRERDNVKELLQHLLLKFKKEVNKELEEKNKVLSENPAMLQLYRDLVITQVISSEEFWLNHTSQFTKKCIAPRQDIGVTGAFLADIKPQTDGCNGLKYNLTSDVIDCIFKTYPAVKKKHMEDVPTKVPEGEFWTKFFQSHYFHRDRLNGATKDLFTDCAKLDDIEMKCEINDGIDDPLLDLSTAVEPYMEDEYGLNGEKCSTVNLVHQSMIKRFNQHSIMVIRASRLDKCSGLDMLSENLMPCNIKAKSINNTTAKIFPDQLDGCCDSDTSSSNSASNCSSPESKKMRLQAKIRFADLTSTINGVVKHKLPSVPKINMDNMNRYLHGPASTISVDLSEDDQVSGSMHLIQGEVNGWGCSHRGYAPVSPAAAVSALGELTPGGALMKGFQEDSQQLVPKETERELKNLYLSLCELLRHFWASFPPTSPTLEVKVVKMHEAIQRFDSARLKPFEDRLLREFSPVSLDFTSHLNQLLTNAYRKFELWQQRKLSR